MRGDMKSQPWAALINATLQRHTWRATLPRRHVVLIRSGIIEGAGVRSSTELRSKELCFSFSWTFNGLRQLAPVLIVSCMNLFREEDETVSESSLKERLKLIC